MKSLFSQSFSRLWLRLRLRLPFGSWDLFASLYRFAQLVSLVKILRSPQGCPWDRAQDLESMLPFLREEALEALDAAHEIVETPQNFQKELGDLFFLLIFLSQICEETKLFSLPQTLKRIVQKMEYRHPHVFGDQRLHETQDIVRMWADRKDQESRKEEAAPSILRSIPKLLPALHRAQRIGEKVAQVDFDWPSTDAIWEKIHEEIDELKDAMQHNDKTHTAAELGDLLFSIAQLSRKLEIDSEEALHLTCRRFTKRFQHIEETLHHEGTRPHDAGQERLEQLWKAAKQAVG